MGGSIIQSACWHLVAWAVLLLRVAGLFSDAVVVKFRV